MSKPPTEDDLTQRTLPVGRHSRAPLEIPECVLRVVAGPDRGHELSVVARSVLIGKGEQCDLLLSDSSVSRLHASITPTPTGFTVEDLGSTNGVEVDGVPVQKAPLRSGCRLLLGNTKIEFSMLRRSLVPKTSDGLAALGLVGKSRAIQEACELVQLVAPTEASVVLRGETGTGKEVAARAIHQLSVRRTGPFVVVDCANMERELLGSALFGHQRGAFTGATQDNKGAFRAADGGTVFLDEVGELPMEIQSRLLGALQRREVQPLGSTVSTPFSVRVLAATHRDLEKMIDEGTFREDLYFRLMVIRVDLPPLRSRPEDIPDLAAHFLAELSPAGREQPRLGPGAAEALLCQSWRGNVRELRNCLERAVVLSRGGEIRPEHLQQIDKASTAKPVQPDGVRIRDLERTAILTALERTGWNKSQTARELGIGLTTLKRKIQEFSLEAPPPDSPSRSRKA